MRLNFVGPTIKHRDRNSRDNVRTGLRSLARKKQVPICRVTRKLGEWTMRSREKITVSR